MKNKKVKKGFSFLGNCQHGVIKRTCTECNSQHTPTPWKAGVRKYMNAIWGPDGDNVAICSGIDSANQANAEFIVRAVNSHEELLSALASVVWYSEFMEGGKYAAAGAAFRKAIAKAEGK